MSELYNAIVAWEDSDKSYEAQPLKEEGESFQSIKDLVTGGAKLTDDEKNEIQKKVYEWNDKTNNASSEGNQAAAVVNGKVCSNLEFALQFYEKHNPN